MAGARIFCLHLARTADSHARTATATKATATQHQQHQQKIPISRAPPTRPASHMCVCGPYAPGPFPFSFTLLCLPAPSLAIFFRPPSRCCRFCCGPTFSCCCCKLQPPKKVCKREMLSHGKMAKGSHGGGWGHCHNAGRQGDACRCSHGERVALLSASHVATALSVWHVASCRPKTNP